MYVIFYCTYLVFLHYLQVPLIVIKLYKPHTKLVIPNRKQIKTVIFLFPLGGRISALNMIQNIPNSHRKNETKKVGDGFRIPGAKHWQVFWDSKKESTVGLQQNNNVSGQMFADKAPPQVQQPAQGWAGKSWHPCSWLREGMEMKIKF